MNTERLIEKIAWHFFQRNHAGEYGIEPKELIAQANLIYCECLENYDESRGKITTFLWTSISRGLKEYMRLERKHHLIPLDEEELPQSHSSFFEKLSEDAMAVAKIVLNAPEDFIVMTQEEAKLKVFTKMLNENYPLQKIMKGFSELIKVYS